VIKYIISVPTGSKADDDWPAIGSFEAENDEAAIALCEEHFMLQYGWKRKQSMFISNDVNWAVAAVVCREEFNGIYSKAVWKGTRRL